MGFKENLRQEMEFRDIKPKELSDLTGLSVNTIRNYINGHNALPSVETGVLIAKALGVTVEYLVTGGLEEDKKQAQRIALDFSKLNKNDQKSVKALISEMLTH